MTENLDQEHIYTKKSVDQIFRTVGFVLILALLITAIVLGFNYDRLPQIKPLGRQDSFKLASFRSEAEMKDYLKNSLKTQQLAGDMPAPLDSNMRGLAESQTAPAAPSYYSQTNVQVAGIDEPDIVKTNGQKIFISTQTPIFRIMERGFEPAANTQIFPPPDIPKSETKIVNAFPPVNLAVESNIETAGELLLEKDVLIVSDGQNLTGFDVSNPKNPEEIWEIEFDNFKINSLRLMDGQIYTVLQKSINRQAPCPIPLTKDTQQTTKISCAQIYYPLNPVAVDSTYTLLKINPKNGQTSDPVSFIGSSLNSIVYMSKNALYITTQNEVNTYLSQLEFLLSDGSDLLPQPYIDRLANVSNLNISSQAKSTETSVILQEYRNNLDEDQILKFDNDLQNRFSEYLNKQMRKLQTTNIAKVNLQNLEIKATGQVPGQLLNQFALDEYNNALRVATTIGKNLPGSEPANDIYVLDQDLKKLGAISNLGLDEQIYAVRFIKDKAFLVTYKQIDPFYVIDLSNPKNPQKIGELKIPGYSSYLHPLSENVILGIGKEDQFVKLTLFDIKQKNPLELDTYLTESYWSETLNNHRAFSTDPASNTFFLPTSSGGLIFNYQDKTLKLEQAVSGVNLKRAIYIDNYLYIVGSDLIVVLDKNNWEKIFELDLN